MPTQHERISKYVLEQALLSDGTVALEKPVAASRERRFDVHFVPRPDRPPASEVDPHAHLLRQMTARECLLEIFSSTPGVETLRLCLCKHLALHHDNRLAAKRARGPRPRLPRLWVLSPGRPTGALHRFRLKPLRGWPPGFYYGGSALGLWLVVLAELPPTARPCSSACSATPACAWPPPTRSATCPPPTRCAGPCFAPWPM